MSETSPDLSSASSAALSPLRRPIPHPLSPLISSLLTNIELQKNTTTLASSRTTSSAAAEPTTFLRGLIKPPAAAVNGAKELDSDDKSRLASKEIDKDNRSEYPDQAAIEAIRKNRENDDHAGCQIEDGLAGAELG